MQFVQGLPRGVFVGQTHIQHAQALSTDQDELLGFNLALHVNDAADRVQKHRMILLDEFSRFGVVKMTWLNQTHSTLCHTVNQEIHFNPLEGDGLVTQSKAHALMMMTADCLPIVLGNAEGSEVANLHAGWRGLASGIIEHTIAEMQSKPHWAWLGAAISQPCFEVGRDVKNAFCSKYNLLESAFNPSESVDKFYADLYAIASYILMQQGVGIILGGEQCSFRQQQQFYSYRRNAKTGRMATFVFMQ